MIAKGGAIAAIEDLLMVEPAVFRTTTKAIGRLRRFRCLLLNNSERFSAPNPKNCRAALSFTCAAILFDRWSALDPVVEGFNVRLSSNEGEYLNQSESEGYVYVRERAGMERLIQRHRRCRKGRAGHRGGQSAQLLRKGLFGPALVRRPALSGRPALWLRPERIIESFGRQAVDSARRRLRSAHDASIDGL